MLVKKDSVTSEKLCSRDSWRIASCVLNKGPEVFCSASKLFCIKLFTKNVFFYSSKASGPECIPVFVLKNCAPKLSNSLAEFFNICLKESFFHTFFNWYFAVPWPTLGHYWEDTLTHLMLITAFLQFWPNGHQEPHSEVGFLSFIDDLVGFEPVTIQI